MSVLPVAELIDFSAPLEMSLRQVQDEAKIADKKKTMHTTMLINVLLRMVLQVKRTIGSAEQLKIDSFFHIFHPFVKLSVYSVISTVKINSITA